MTATHTGVEIITVMAGQELELPDGAKTIAVADCIQVSTVVEDVPTGLAFVLTPEAAMDLASNLASRAGEMFAARVDDSGKKLGLLAALRDMGRKA